MYDENKLPKWAKQRLEDLRHEIIALQSLKKLHALLSDKDRDWFVIKGPEPNTGEDHINLWVLYPNKPHSICVLGKDDMLFVGRAL